MAETPRRREPILGKKEQRVVGLFSAGRGEEGGRMGVRDDEEKEVGRPGEGVRGVAGLEGGNEDGLEVVSSAELSDSLRKWVYLVLGTSSILSISLSLSAQKVLRSSDYAVFVLPLKASLGMDEPVPLASIVHNLKKWSIGVDGRPSGKK